MRPAAGPRIELIDALRGMGLIGILQVNVQSFTWGAVDPLGYLADPPGRAESALYFLQAAFFQGKFYPIFAFLFGAGLSLQARGARPQRAPGAQAVPGTLRRRLVFLLLLGIAHGLLLYSGDILSAYAVCGLLFVALAPARLRALASLAGMLWVAAALSIFLPLLYAGLPGAGDPGQAIPEAASQAHRVYTEGGFVAQLKQRVDDELWQQLTSMPALMPQALALFALGSLAARLGWLRDPRRHPLVWRRARNIGIWIGLPCSLAGAALALARARDAPGDQGQWDAVLQGAGSLLAAAYVGAVATCSRSWCGDLRRWMACAGRLSLSNYVGQSLAMGALLSGWGLGLGAGAGRGALAAAALAISAVQVVLSRWFLSKFDQGPLEALWRRWAYG